MLGRSFRSFAGASSATDRLKKNARPDWSELHLRSAGITFPTPIMDYSTRNLKHDDALIGVSVSRGAADRSGVCSVAYNLCLIGWTYTGNVAL